MNTSRLAILGGLAVALAILAATQTCRERPSEADPPVAKAEPKGGVGSRASDTPMDLRERDRLRDEATDPAGVVATPEPAPEPAPADSALLLKQQRAAAEPAEPAVLVGPPPSPTIEASLLAAKTAAKAEIAKIHGEMRRKCWDELDRGGKGDGGVKVSFSLSIDAQGHMLASAVNQQSRENYIMGLESCLAPFAHGLEISGPGESVSIEVDVELP